MNHIQQLANYVNRTYSQEVQLYDLCGKDIEKLTLLEFKIKMNNISYCPSTIEEVNEILNKKS